MPASHILLHGLDPPRGRVLFDLRTGAIAPGAGKGSLNQAQGNCAQVGKRLFALYQHESCLYLQQGAQRWPLSDRDTHIHYGHNFETRRTAFGVGDLHIEYPAWWAAAPRFEPNLPELDEAHDYLACVFAVHQNEPLQSDLLRAWSQVDA